MRTWIAGIVLPFVAVGCSPKEAKSGREFLEKFQEAERARDGSAVWNLIAKESREALMAETRKEVDGAKGKPEAAEKLKERYGLKEDPTQMDLEKLTQARLGKELEAHPTGLIQAKFVEEKEQGEQVVLVVEIEGKGKKEIGLLREEGTLRMKWVAGL